MDIERALFITRDRIENMKRFIPSNVSEKQIAKETVEWLEFVEEMLEDKQERL